MSCPGCGAGAPDGARFCPECGHLLVSRPDERRLVTVLMADVVGFTQLSETADPETVKNLIDRCFEGLVSDVQAFGGHLDKIVGDQIVAQFGAPVAHEDDAERAVRAGLKMRATLDDVAHATGRRLDLRIGINTGEVVVGAMRAGGDATVMGDVVNTASRLQTSAEPGQVVVGPATYQATNDVVHYEPLGALNVRGRGEAVEAWLAIGAKAPPGRNRRARRASLVGRDPEMGALRHAFHLAAKRQRAHAVLIIGDAGVGKSRLALELATTAKCEHEALVMSGQCVAYGEANVWAPIAEAIRHACGFDRDAPLLEARDQLTEAVRLATELPVGHSELERIVDGILYVTDGFSRPAVDPKRARDDAMRAVAAFLEGHARRRPVVFNLSDFHWADDALFPLIDRLLRRMRALPFVFVATARRGFEERWTPPPGHHNTLVLHLDPLDANATAALARELFDGALDDDLIAFLQERSGGNPFFIEELVALVCDDSGGIVSGGLGALPATLHGLLAARLDTLSPQLRSLLEDLAVVGSQGSLDIASALTGPRDLGRDLRELEDRDLIAVDEGDFRFKSELIRDVAYNTLTKGERARRHSLLAERLGEREDTDPEFVAHHLACAAELIADVGHTPGVPSDIRERAAAALEAAAQHTESVESWISSGLLWERALALLSDEPGPQRWTALLGRARARDAFRELDTARDDVMIVLEEARDAESMPHVAQALLVLGRVETDSGNFEAAEHAYGEAISALRSTAGASGVADALRGLGMVRLFQGELDEAEHLSSDALAAYNADGDQRGEAWAHQNLAWIAFSRGSTAVAEDRLNSSAELFAEIGDWGGVSWALGLLAFVRYNQGRLDEAEELANQISIEANETGNRWAEGMMELLLGDIACWRGRAEEAVDRGTKAVAMFKQMGDEWAFVMAAAPMTRALATLGRSREADELLRDFTPAAERLPDPMMRRIAELVEAAILVERGDGEQALAFIEAADRTTGVDGARPNAAAVDRVLSRGLALVQTGRPDDAVALASEPYAAAEDDGPRAALGGLLVLAHAAAGRAEQALALAEDLAAVRGGTFMDRLLARWGAAVAYATRGEVLDAVAALDDAYAIAYATDSRVLRAVTSLVRARLFEALALPSANEAVNEANLALHSAGISAVGWERAVAIPAERAEFV